MCPQLAIVHPATASPSRQGLIIPEGLSTAEWAKLGEQIDTAGRAVMWWTGDWWAYGEHAYGDRKALLEDLTQSGLNLPAYHTCRKAGIVARRFQMARRRSRLSFDHHAAVLALSDQEADYFLDRAEANCWPRATLVAEVRRYKLEALRRPGEKLFQTQTVDDLHDLVADGQRFGTIYADPPWPYGNQATRAATKNHYKAHNELSLDDIAALPIVDLAADASHCHLWTTNGFLREAFDIMSTWGFTYKSCFIWVKPDFGIGNYWRVGHEFMLFGIRGKCPFTDNAQQSWIYEKAGEHSAKPPKVRKIIELTSPGLELFGRNEIENWTVWGNETTRPLI